MVEADVPDGIGGFTHGWTEGTAFIAAIVKDRTAPETVAERESVAETYTVTVPVDLGLKFHDVFKRVSDGQVFRVTSNIIDSRTPGVASFQFGQVSAERWVLA